VGLLCVSCMHDTASTSWPGFTKFHSLDGIMEVAGATGRQYLALTKAQQFCHLCLLVGPTAKL